MPDVAFGVEASPVATNDPTPLFLSDHAEEPQQPGIDAWDDAWDEARDEARDGAVIASRTLKASILVVAAAAAIGFAILSVGNPLVFFANATAFLVATSAPQDGTDQPTPTMQATAGAQDLPAGAEPASARDAPTRDEIAAAFKNAGQTEAQAEIRQAPAEPLLNQFQAWAAEEDARAGVRPAQDAQAQPAQDVQAQPLQEHPLQEQPLQEQPLQDAQVQPLEDARSQTPPVQRHRRVHHVQNARAEIRVEQDLRARLRRKQMARAQVRPVQVARPQDRPLQDAQPPSLLQSLGLRN